MATGMASTIPWYICRYNSSCSMAEASSRARVTDPGLKSVNCSQVPRTRLTMLARMDLKSLSWNTHTYPIDGLRGQFDAQCVPLNLCVRFSHLRDARISINRPLDKAIRQHHRRRPVPSPDQGEGAAPVGGVG